MTSLVSSNDSSFDRKRSADLDLLVFGGRIAAEHTQGTDCEWGDNGSEERIQHIIKGITGVYVEEVSKILGPGLTKEGLENFGKRMQSIDKPTVALVGSKRAPRFAAAASMALQPEQLQEGNRSLVLACCNHALGHSESDAEETIQAAVQLARHPEMQGRAGLLFGPEKLYGLNNLQTSHDDPPSFFAKFGCLANRNGRWMFSELQGHHEPAGAGTEFSLVGDVRTLVIPDSGPDRERETDFTKLLDSSGEFTDNLKGVVLRTNSYRDVSQFADPDTMALLANLHIPVMLLGEQSEAVNGRQDVQGRNNNILRENSQFFDGDGLYSGQAKVILAAMLGEAQQKGLEKQADILGHIRERLKQLPFINRQLEF